MAKRRDDNVDSRHDLSNNFVASLAADWKANGAAVIQKVREEAPEKYCQLIANVVPKEMLIASDRSPKTDAPTDSRSIAEALLHDVGLSEPDDKARQRALDAYDTLIMRLEEIRDEALH